MRKINYSTLSLSLLIILFSSCNVSLNILNRKYRPGYSVFSSITKNHRSNILKEQEILIDSCADSGLVIMENNVVATSDNSELFIDKSEFPEIATPCDTPPKKNTDDPNWSLYKEKNASEVGAYKGRILEPYGTLAIFFLLLGFFITNLLAYLNVWIFLFVFFSVFIMSVISLVKMKKAPDKYMRIFKVTDWIFLACYILGLFILLAAI